MKDRNCRQVMMNIELFKIQSATLLSNIFNRQTVSETELETNINHPILLIRLSKLRTKPLFNFVLEKWLEPCINGEERH